MKSNTILFRCSLTSLKYDRDDTMIMTKDALKKSNDWLRVVGDLSSATIQNYKQAVALFEESTGKTMDELIEIALNEQDERIAEHKLSTYDWIIEFRLFLTNQGRIASGVNKYTNLVKTVFRKSRVRVPYIPPMNEINAKHNAVITFEDYLTKDEIKKAIQYLPLIQQARAMAMVTGGLSNDECASLKTRQHFIEPLRKYHQCDDDVEALQWLAESDNVLWIVCIKRGKTGKPFYAIMNPETVTLTAKAKLRELGKKNGLKDKLYPTTKQYFGKCCRNINESLNLGTAGGKTRFRPHMLRKFNATAIRGNYSIADNGLSPSQIDELQGRGMTSVQATYIKSNPIKQKFLYCQVINNVSLWHKYDFRVTADDDVELFVVDDEVQAKKLKKENQMLREKLEVSQDIREDVKNLISDKGIDEVADIIQELLKAS